MWVAYAIWNDSKKQVYIGVTNDFDNRKKEHMNGKCSTTASWFKDGDSVGGPVRLPNARFSTQYEASEWAHRVEREADANDYEIIETAGI
jgi:GIY-YIG catalytic domain